MSKRAKPVKKRKRTDWKERCQEFQRQVLDWQERYEVSRREAVESNAWMVERKTMLFSASNELSKYRLICDWACQRIEELEMVDLSLEKSLTEEQRYIGNLAERLHTMQSEKRILLDTLFEVQAENIMQGEDILRQREELIKLRGCEKHSDCEDCRTRDRELVEKLEGLAAEWEDSLVSPTAFVEAAKELRAVLAARKQ